MTSSDESKYLFRVFAVNMGLSGIPAFQVGASAGYTKAAVTGWVKLQTRKGLRRFDLSNVLHGSSDLNPIEQVWRITRHEYTHNVFFSSLSLLESTINLAFAAWATPNNQLKYLPVPLSKINFDVHFKSYHSKKSVAYSGFVSYGSGELFVTKSSWFNLKP